MPTALPVLRRSKRTVSLRGFAPNAYPLGSFVDTYPLGDFPNGHYPLSQKTSGHHAGPRPVARAVFQTSYPLGDNAPNAIRLYVPRLASGLHALTLSDTGLTYGALAHPSFGSARWNNAIATEFSRQAQKYLGFVPVVHESEGSEVVFAHMTGSFSHVVAEALWAPMQSAIDAARRRTGTPALADPGVGSGGAAPAAPEQAAAAPSAAQSIWDFVTGTGLVILGIVL